MSVLIGPAAGFAVDWHVNLHDYIIDVAWSSASKFLAAMTVEGHVQAWNLDSGESCLTGRHPRGGASVSWRPDDLQLASIGHDGKVRIWSAPTGALLHELDAGATWGTRVAWKPNGARLAAAAGRIVRIFDTAGHLHYEYSEHPSTVTDIGWNPDGSALASSACLGVLLHIPGKPLREFSWRGSSRALAWSPDSRFIATGEQDQSVHLWYVRTGRDSQMSGFALRVEEMSWDHTARYLATGGSDTVVIWDCSGAGPEGRRPVMLESHNTRITQLQYQPRGPVLASGDADGDVFLWAPRSRSTPIAIARLGSRISKLAWAADQKRLVVGTQRGDIVVLRSTLESGQ